MPEKSKVELKKVSYKSAVFIGVVSLVMYLLVGIMNLTVVKNQLNALPADILQQNTQYQAALEAMTPLNSLVLIPIVAGIVGYLLSIIAILIYNIVASRFPVSWEIKK